MGRLQNKSAVILGASKRDNMGQVIARRFMSEGARVVAAGRDRVELDRFAESSGATAIPCDITKKEDIEAKLVFLAQSMRAKLLTTDYNLAKMAEFQGVPWLNLNKLSKSLQPELMIGEQLEIELVKPGKEDGQAIGYLADGSMVVVTGGRPHIGQLVGVEIISLLPTGAGKMIFARMNGDPDQSKEV